jgi:hypothetical protein
MKTYISKLQRGKMTYTNGQHHKSDCGIKSRRGRTLRTRYSLDTSAAVEMQLINQEFQKFKELYFRLVAKTGNIDNVPMSNNWHKVVHSFKRDVERFVKANPYTALANLNSQLSGYCARLEELVEASKQTSKYLDPKFLEELNKEHGAQRAIRIAELEVEKAKKAALDEEYRFDPIEDEISWAFDEQYRKLQVEINNSYTCNRAGRRNGGRKYKTLATHRLGYHKKRQSKVDRAIDHQISLIEEEFEQYYLELERERDMVLYSQRRLAEMELLDFQNRTRRSFLDELDFNGF